MKHKTLMLGLSVIVVLGLVAPALANPAGGAGTIVVTGAATVGKVISNRTNTDCVVSGGGLGFPIISQAKNAWFRLFTPDITLINATGFHAGALSICGRLLPTLDNLIKVPGNTKKGIGAACGMSKAHDGRGLLNVFAGPKAGNYWLTDVGWKISVPALFETAVITGKIHRGNDGSQGKGKTPVDGFVGLVFTAGGSDCISKRDNPKIGAFNTGPKQANQGARTFSIFSVWTVVPDGAFLGNRNDLPTSPKGSNDMPFFCKKDKKDPDPCAYKTKK